MKKTFSIAFLFLAFHIHAQVGVGTILPNSSSALDVTSTTKGFLLPRMTDSQKMAITSPASGLWVWCTDCGPRGQMQVYNGVKWTNMIGGDALNALLIDQVGISPKAAYSVRLLSSSYTGNAIKVRRSSDNTESDIGFDNNGDLNETALLSFVGSGDGFVTIWYDQSGNANHAINTTTGSQPQIVFSGVINKMNGKAALKGSISRNTRLQTTPISPITINQMSIVGQGEANSSQYVIFLQQSGPSAYFRYNPTGNIESWSIGTSAINSTSTHFTPALMIYTSQNSTGKLYSNGLQIGSGASSSASASGSLYTLFNNPGNSSPLNGSISELILFPSNVNRSILESNQGTYYSITIN